GDAAAPGRSRGGRAGAGHRLAGPPARLASKGGRGRTGEGVRLLLPAPQVEGGGGECDSGGARSWPGPENVSQKMGAGGLGLTDPCRMRTPTAFEPRVVVADRDDRRAGRIADILRQDFRIIPEPQKPITSWTALLMLLQETTWDGIALLILPENLDDPK